MSYQVDGAVIKEQGVTFAIVVVKHHVLQSTTDKENALRAFSPLFPRLPLILMAQDSRGIPTYFGRRDIVNFLANVDPGRISWKRYTVNN